MAGGFLGGLFGSQGSPAQVVTTSPFDQMQQGGQGGNFGDLANTNSTYLADLYSQLGTGQTPSYYQSYQNQAMPYYQNMLNQQYFGSSGNRSYNPQTGGVSGQGMAMDQAALLGLNPKATSGLMNKNYLQYQNASNQLDQYFAGQGLNTIQDTAKSLPGWATGQQNALTSAFDPRTNVIPAQAGSSGPLPGLLGAMGQGGMFNGMGSNIMSMFGGGGGAAGLASALPSFGGGAASFAGPTMAQLAGPLTLMGV